MKLAIAFGILFISSLAAAQCEQMVPGPGTQCNGPILIDSPTNPTTFFRFTPETAQFACPSGATASFWSVCGRNGELEVDYGSGYVSLKGKDGTNGVNGIDGINGKNAVISIGTVTSGTTPTVTNSGTPQNAVLNFVLQPGPQGSPGLKVGSSGTLILTCQPEAKHSISTGFSTTCTYKVTQ